MNEHLMIIDLLREVKEDLGEQWCAFALAAKYCPDPWSKNLEAISNSLMFLDLKLGDVISQTEAVFNGGGNDLFKNVEAPRD